MDGNEGVDSVYGDRKGFARRARMRMLEEKAHKYAMVISGVSGYTVLSCAPAILLFSASNWLAPTLFSVACALLALAVVKLWRPGPTPVRLVIPGALSAVLGVCVLQQIAIASIGVIVGNMISVALAILLVRLDRERASLAES